MNKTLQALLARKAAAVSAMQAITKKAETENRDLTDEERAAVDAQLAITTGLNADIEREKAVIEATRSIEVPGSAIVSVRQNVENDPRRGFANFGDFAHSVMGASIQRAMDPRLAPQAAAPSTYGNENVGVDGGYLVPTEFASAITALALGVDSFLPMCDSTPISGNSMTFPSDETTPWGSNGVRAYWAAEATVATATKPIIKPNTMRLNKLFALTPVTDELLADAPAISSYLTALIARSINWKTNDAIINGTGAGQPLGILNGPGLAVVNKESGQATLTLNATNIAKMYAAMPAEWLANAVWIITPDVLPQLMVMTLGNFAIWTPPTQGFSGAPGGFLFGKPVILSQTAAAFSSQGDVIFTTFKAYRTISKDGIQMASSMHLYFDADSTAFRATFRLDGQPVFKSTITQARGSQALSPYVTLQAR